jgi:SHS2 domain-containing protein
MNVEARGVADDLYREFEHTGDMGIEVEGATRGELFARALAAMGRIMVEPDGVRAAERKRIEVRGDDDVERMHDLLAEALNAFLADGFIWRDATVAEAPDGALIAELAGEPYMPRRHQLVTEVKAVTYHALSVGRADGRWRARIVFDV